MNQSSYSNDKKCFYGNDSIKAAEGIIEASDNF